MPKKIITTLASLGLLFGAPVAAFATGDLHYNTDTTLTVGSFTLTIVGGSDATQVIVSDNATLTVVVPGSHTFTLSIPTGSLTTSPNAVEQSCGTPNAVALIGPGTFVVTPSSAACTKASTVVVAAPSSSSQTTTQTPASSTTTTTDSSKTFTFESPKETKVTAPTSSTSSGSTADSKQDLLPSMTAPTKEFVQELKETAKEIAVVPKKITLDADDKQILAEAKKAGVAIDTSGSGKKAQASATKANALVVNFLTTDASEALEDKSVAERAAVLKEVQYFIGSKLKTEADVTKALKIAEGIPLSDKELGKTALNDIKRNENAFCKPGVCKGYAVFASVLRGADPGDLSAADQKRGVAAFKKNVGRAPNLANPLHQNLVEAFAVADLSKVKPPVKDPAKTTAKKK